jgi:hypothetical protein
MDIRMMFTLSFQMFWQDGEIVEATNTGKLTAAEQGRTH